MLRITDITFHANTEYADTEALVKAQFSSLNYLAYMEGKMEVELIKHIGNSKTVILPRKQFRFFRSRNGFFHIPISTFRYLQKKQPDVLLVQGLCFPFRVMILKLFFLRKTRILVKHHADLPPVNTIRKMIYRMADLFIDIYLFTSVDNAKSWIDAGIILSKSKIRELPATMTDFTCHEKSAAQKQLHLDNGTHYLWVGRLNLNKDPITVLEAFTAFAAKEENVFLHFIYQTDELLLQMKKMIDAFPHLQRQVFFHGTIAYDLLPVWYAASDYYFSQLCRGWKYGFARSHVLWMYTDSECHPFFFKNDPRRIVWFLFCAWGCASPFYCFAGEFSC